MVPRRAAVALAALALGLAAPGRSEVYRWTDAQGRVHFTEDLGQVPAERRAAARAEASTPAAAGSLQTFETAPRARSARRFEPGSRRRHRVAVERAGMGLVVPVRLNDRVEAPFLIDTGASYVLLPRALADELGIEVGPETRRLVFQTANGVVEQPVVMLESVELGTARAEEVPASISPSMEIGLLGLSFFHRFTYQIDASQGEVTLVENDLAESGAIRGGRSEAQWRGEFEALRARGGALEVERARTPATRSRRIEWLDAQDDALARELEQLEAEADQARVPDSWRR
jgi:clan AA aspartic protease (TIGR02281 family)